MKKYVKKFIIVLLVTVGLFIINVQAQNVAITDDDAYTAHPSAMLDVKSLTKGMLVPRMTTLQREAITDPATGLLVFDTDELSFYLFGGGDWTNLSTGNPSDLWSLSGSNVYLTDADYNLGIGSTTPVCKLEVKGDAQSGVEEPLFAVVNNSGDTVFAVYPEGVRIWVADDPAKASGSKGGFAVGGFSSAKGVTNEYLRVTPDSVRIYIDDEFAKASKGGFAVGGFSQGKGLTDDYLFIEREQSRIYVDGNAGFAVSDISGGGSVEYLDLTPQNYFIGHESGISNTSGQYNLFLGYQSGRSNTQGVNNVFMGYQSGNLNTNGWDNVYIGTEAGLAGSGGELYNNICIGSQSGRNNTMNRNVFIGNEAGKNNAGVANIFIGSQAGISNSGGIRNIFIGVRSGESNVDANDNIFIGDIAGFNNTTGASNIFIGGAAGSANVGGNNNIFIGNTTGSGNTSGSCNTFIGRMNGGSNSTGNYNTFFGYLTGGSNSTASNNLFLGYYAGYSNTTGWYNTFVGTMAGGTKTGGSSNTLIGYKAGYSNGTGAGNVFIGYQAGSGETGSNLLYIDNSSTTQPLVYGDFSSNYFKIYGEAHGTGAWISDSDERLKKNIQTIKDPLSKVMKLRGITFKWKNNDVYTDAINMGFVAQEAMNIIPEVVYNEKGYYSMQYAPITALLVEAMKEQQKQIEELHKENKSNDKKISSLRAEINDIKSILEASTGK